MSSLLTSAAGGAVSKVASLATEQLKLEIVCCFHKELKKLEESSTKIRNIIHDVAHGPEDPELWSRADWMKRLIGVAHDAEDILGEVQYEVDRIKIEETSLDKKILGFFCSNPLVFRLQMARKIHNITTSLDDLYKEAAAMPSRSNGVAAASQDMRETTSLPEKNELTGKDAIIIGRDGYVSDIIAKLTNSNNQEKILSVMAIVGLGGLGKTTLAQLVTKQLKEGEMKKYFDSTFWVYTSRTLDINKILQHMVHSCDQTSANLSTRDLLIESLRNKLTEKRVFLVLDDVWDEHRENWVRLRDCLLLLNFAKGSTVIVTTRLTGVASIMEAIMEPLPRWDLNPLSDDECWSILKDRAFADPNDPIASEREEIGKKLAKNCAGLPLAAKVLGSLMRSKRSEDEWSSMLGNKIWELSLNNEDSRIMSVLMLSFDNLKSPLKQCFAYCSMLERGSLIDRDELIQLWMAQGLLQPSPQQRRLKMEMEDVGNEYVDTLLKNSLLEDATKDMDAIITKCKMHDLLHDLAVEVSKGESWTPDFNNEMDGHEIRHVARLHTSKLQSMPETNFSRLRSLFSNVEVLNMISPTLRALRVFSLCEANNQESLDSIGKLKHLKYLDLSETKIKAVPESIGKLYNLQTLRLPLCLNKCPKEIQNLINLRHLYGGDRMEFEAGILGRLTKLRTLPCFNVGKERGSAIEDLGGLKHLRGHLIICQLEHVRDGDEAKNACLVKKSHLSELTCEWTYHRRPNDNEKDVLDGLEPHLNLQSLNIENFMGAAFPSWITSLQNLKKIRLVCCHNCEGVPTLGHLPNLRSLEINTMDKLTSVKADFYGYSDTSTTLFPALKTLFIACGELIDWMEAPRISAVAGEVEVFPCLEELQLSGCRKLRNAPSRFPCLKRLWIYGMGSNMPIENISTQLTTLTYLSIDHVEEITCLPEGMLKKNKSLTYLEIRHCDELTCIAPDVFDSCTSLRSLIVINCKKLRHLPDGLDTLPHLEELRISGCPGLESFRITQGIASLRQLNISGCKGLSSLEVGLDYCTSLQELYIYVCPNLVSIPIAHGMPSLRKLNLVGCDGLSSLGSGLNYCTSLQELELCHCHNLTSIPITQGITSLQKLRIVGCQRLLSLPSGLQFCTSLEYLDIGPLGEELDAFPDFQLPPNSQQIQHLTCLKTLWISDFKGLEALPEWLGNLTSLENLKIWFCENLKYLPTQNAMKNLTKLKELDIVGCLRLKERCTKETGPEWPKISHIPEVYFR